MHSHVYSFGPSDDPGGGDPGSIPFRDPTAGPGDDLAYRVEITDGEDESVDQVLAVTASASIGYAAFYAATREFPGRTIVLRHRGNVLSRWRGQPN